MTMARRLAEAWEGPGLSREETMTASGVTMPFASTHQPYVRPSLSAGCALPSSLERG
jgi:hypothetical protein